MQLLVNKMLPLLIVGFVSLIFVFSVYFLYYLLIYRTRKLKNYLNIVNELQVDSNLPLVSIIVSTYNEEKVIGRKLKNISELDYPQEKLEVVVLDDCSVDDTYKIAKKKLDEYSLHGRVLLNQKRIGLNESLNIAFREASNSIICVTDSDVTLEKSSLKNAISVLENFEDAGGVTGKIEPVFSKKAIASASENSYRDFYHKCMLSESSLHSAFPGNGPLILFNKSLVTSSIPVRYGSTDANIAMNIVKSGKRLLYVPNAIIHEPVPETLDQQRLQKVRRAKRLIQAFIHNMNVFANSAYGKFGTLIFPLKLLMHVFCPVIFFIGVFSTISFFLLSGSLMLQILFGFSVFSITFVLAIFRRARMLVSSFIFHQVYLVLGLLSLTKRTVFWKTIERREVNT
jgi:cellulose synthase/poly-beta-1,6-N-acetylglucosamine synthase-like glycosyltransferase